MSDQAPATLSLADEEFQRTYVVLLDARLKRSAALFYDATDAKFTLVEKATDQEEAVVFDAAPREQWGRNVLVFGHATNSGGFVACGHGSLTGSIFFIKLLTGVHYRFEVDPTLDHLLPLFVEAPNKKPEKSRRSNNRNSRGQAPIQRLRTGADPVRPSHERGSFSDDREEHEDFSAEDLRRLRGEVPMTSKKRRY